MTRFERLLARRWRTVFLVCVLIALCGVAVILWARIDAGDRRADQMRQEADRRGLALATLAEDVRALREQVERSGETPAAPDPAQAVEGLLDRVRVPAGARGAEGKRGEQGEAGAAGARGPRGPVGPAGPAGPAGEQGLPGADGRDGVDGSDGAPGAVGPVGPAGPQGGQGETGASGPQGPEGPQGTQGPQGPQGETGAPGPACPEGYTLQIPDYDPEALVCRKAPAAPAPAPEQPEGQAGFVVLPLPRRRFRTGAFNPGRGAR
ncbi:collagen-like protein [Streptomyces sp. NPDC051940]|uniref:collagen-like protein n=1 Tax=Streptomyces sp. NPDC051940 TaxID=3155675 RepID=UPI00342A87BC